MSSASAHGVPPARGTLLTARGGLVVLLAAIVAGGFSAWIGHRAYVTAEQFIAVAVVAAAIGFAVAVWYLDPAYTLTGALCLTVFSGHWGDLGLPNFFAPDRFAVVVVVIALAAQAPGVRRRQVATHLPAARLAIVVAALFVIIDAAVTGTLIDSLGTYRLFDRFGLLPFAVFWLAPTVYATKRDRAVLVAALVALGAYLSFTALAQAVGADSLVWPSYILDPSLKTHLGRARGPFVQAAVNGMAMYACGIACIMAFLQWRSEWARRAAVVVGLMCVVGLLLTLQRSIWVGSTVATVVILVCIKEARRFAPHIAATAVVLIAGSLVLIPGLATKAAERRDQSETVSERVNMTMAALDMLSERPLVGFGWSTFERRGDEHYQLSDDRSIHPLSGDEPVHNVYASNLAEIGLVGTSLWLLALALAIGGAVLRRGPPEARAWRAMLGAVALLWGLVAFVSPLSDLFPNLLLWLLAGVVVAASADHEPEAAT